MRKASVLGEKKSFHTVETQKSATHNKMFFNCWEMLFEYTFLEECRDTPLRIRLGEFYTDLARWVKSVTMRSLVFAMRYFTPYVFAIEWMVFLLKQEY